MNRASLLFMILLGVMGCRSTPQPAASPAPLSVQLPSFDQAEIIKVRRAEGYAVVRDLKMHAPGTSAQVFRNRVAVGTVKVESARRRPFIIVQILSGSLRAGDTLSFSDSF